MKAQACREEVEGLGYTGNRKTEVSRGYAGPDEDTTEDRGQRAGKRRDGGQRVVSPRVMTRS